MKSIGIFGDSFAGMINSLEYAHTHWSRLLAKHYDVPFTDYSLQGSPVYYSYKQFIKNYEQHDLNIFCVTDPDRYHTKVKTRYQEMYIGGAAGADRSVSPRARDLRGWFTCQTREHSIDMTELMIDHVRRLDSNVIIIPCFPHSLTEQHLNELGLGKEHNMLGFADLQIAMYGLEDYNQFRKIYAEGRAITGHLFPECNEIFFSILKDRIDTGVWNWQFPEKINLKYEVDRYYERKNK